MGELNEKLGTGIRRKVYRVIKSSPGLHFREVQRRTKAAVGNLQYHLDYLQKEHLIRSMKDGKFVRYFAVRGKQLGEDEKTIGLLRKESIRKIVLFLQTKRRAQQATISKQISLTPSTTSFHLKTLLDAGLIKAKRSGKKTFYALIEKEKTANLLVEYKKSFLDDMVDSFVEVWEEFD